MSQDFSDPKSPVFFAEFNFLNTVVRHLYDSGRYKDVYEILAVASARYHDFLTDQVEKYEEL